MTDDTGYDLISPPDAASEPLRQQLQALALATGLMPRGQRRALQRLAEETLELLAQLLTLRRVLIVLMQAGDTPAVAFPFQALTLAGQSQLRVRHEPALGDVLQVSLPGDGALEVVSSRPTPGPSPPDAHLREALEALHQALVNGAGPDTLLALVDAALRS